MASLSHVRSFESTDARSRRASRALTRRMEEPGPEALPWVLLLLEVAEDFVAEGHGARARRMRRRLKRDLARLPDSASVRMLSVRLAEAPAERDAALDALPESLSGRRIALRDGWRAERAWARGEADALSRMEQAFYALGAQVPDDGGALRHHEDLAWQADQISRWAATLGRADDALRWRRVALAFLTQAEQRPRLRAMQAHHEEALGRMLLAEERYAEASETLCSARDHAVGEARSRLELLLREAERKAAQRRDERGLK